MSGKNKSPEMVTWGFQFLVSSFGAIACTFLWFIFGELREMTVQQATTNQIVVDHARRIDRLESLEAIRNRGVKGPGSSQALQTKFIDHIPAAPKQLVVSRWVLQAVPVPAEVPLFGVVAAALREKIFGVVRPARASGLDVTGIDGP